METRSYLTRRLQLTQYFDRTAAANWARLTSDAPVSRIRATVRAGRDEMRDTLLAWLPGDMRGMSLLDAGCGTGALAIEAAMRGATVTAIDVSETLVGIARERTPAELAGQIHFGVGDMLTPDNGPFDYAVAMDSIIHYQHADKLSAIATLAGQTTKGVLFTFAPRTPALAVMHNVGRLIPRSDDRAPAIEPISEGFLRQGLEQLPGWVPGRTQRVSSGFYKSQAMELLPR